MNKIFKYVFNLAIWLSVVILNPNILYAKQLLVYTAMEVEKRTSYKAAFEKLNPDIEIKWIYDTTPVITKKIINENPDIKADFIWGLSLTSLLELRKATPLLEYKPKNFENLNFKFVDQAKIPTWYGMSVFSSVLCFSPKLAEIYGIVKPISLEDLIHPSNRGLITMPAPNLSSIGFNAIMSWFKLYGETQAWEFMDELDKNIMVYTANATKSCQSVAIGNNITAIGLDFRALQLIESGADLVILTLGEGIGWDLEVAAILKSTKNLPEAQKLADFAVSNDANELYSRFTTIAVHNNVKKRSPFLPNNFDKSLVRQNYTFTMANKERIIAEWLRRYGHKVEKIQN